ncbi:MAG: response regulator, partial [Rhodospirillales bacterium]|nr:response regulator [Rhodospirillales bacterium]
IRTAKDSANPMVPVIVLSGETRLTKVMAARDAGMTEFLAKPISAKTFYARLLSALEKPRPFVKALSYFGPDRRRREISQGRDRRRSQPVILTQKR